MDSTCVDGNLNSNSEMEDEIDNCMDDKVCVHETVISAGFINENLHDTDNKQRNIYNYVPSINKNIVDRTAVGFINENSCDMEYKQGANIKHENIDDLTVVVPATELISNTIDNKVSLNKTAISGQYMKPEPGGIKDEQRVIQNYISLKDEKIDDMTVVAQEIALVTDSIDNKICVYETLNSGRYIKEESGCEECGEEYDLYCLKCPMLIRIFDSNNPNGKDLTVSWTLPKNFVDISETPCGLGIVALRSIPKGVVFGPFKGLDSTKDGTVSKWKLKNKELAYIKDPRWLNWMQYIKVVDQNSHQNLVPFQYKGQLYYRSECHINLGDELLVCWDSDSKESDDQEVKDTYWEPWVCESLDDSYACTFCCVGYKSINQLKAHNSICVEKRNKKDFCGEIVQCDICKIYLDKKEYTDYHIGRCSKSNGKCRTDGEDPLRYRIHNGNRCFSCTLCSYRTNTNLSLKRHIATHNNDRAFACTLCPYKTARKPDLKQHIAIHNGDKPYTCTLCPYKATSKSNLTRHIVIHNGDKPFACTLCPYKATRKSDLKQHSIVHSDDKPFACTLCPYKAKKALALNRHIANHNDDKPFACSLCPYKTTRNSDLKQHIAVHNNDKPFACTLCQYKAASNSNLKRHIRTHNDNRPFPCSRCSYKAKTNENLKRHVVSHH